MKEVLILLIHSVESVICVIVQPVGQNRMREQEKERERERERELA